ncbi:MAG: LamB/YcsF family protein [Acidobacteria bacterium]|nr:LamB/YcsF family protein [Acidobacteriota bacterium]
MTIDLNCDMGEREDIDESLLLPLITSANVSCGAHAGTPDLIKRTLRQAKHHNVTCGAHPGYPDPRNFGRLSLPLTGTEIESTLIAQLEALSKIAAQAGVELAHVKPHGALYNDAAKNQLIAAAIARAVLAWNPRTILVGLAGKPVLQLWRDMGLRTAAEAFADRAYLDDGSLMPRSRPGSLLTNPEDAAAQAVQLARRGDIQTLCIHSDTPGAAAIAAAVRAHLLAESITPATLTIPS